MSKIIKSVSIDDSFLDIINNHIDNLSEFVNECLSEKFMTIEKIDYSINVFKKKIKFLEKLKEELKINNKLTGEQEDYLIKTTKYLKEEQDKLKPRYKYFCNHFNKKLSLTEFKKLLEKYGN